MRRLAPLASACLAATLTLVASAHVAHATANYVYHEQTTNLTGGTCGTYLTTPAPGPTDTYPIKWKIEYMGYTDNTVVYYTTDGSMPSGSFGVATSGTSTQVLAGAYGCTFGTTTPCGSATVDVANTTIPAQSAGTKVEYIIGAWHSGTGAGPEVFANSGTCLFCGTCTVCTTSSCATVFTYTVSGVDAGTPDATPLDMKASTADTAASIDSALTPDMKVTPDMTPLDMKVTPDMAVVTDMKITTDMAAKADTVSTPDAGVPDAALVDAPTTDAAPAEAAPGNEIDIIPPDVGASMMPQGSQGCGCTVGGRAPAAPVTGGALLLLAFLALPLAASRRRRR